MNAVEIQEALQTFLRDAYPAIDIRVEPWPEDRSRWAVYFRDEKFAVLYPQQRFHYLSHLIPAEFRERELTNSVWFELAPGETPADLVYPDEELVRDITEPVMNILRKSGFFGALDEAFTRAEQPATCSGDFRVAKSILPSKGFSDDEHFDIFHVLMAQGGYCDCEILYNVAPHSELARRYWRNRPQGPHS
ncbi:MAG TPA: DUF2695 domain-containing protein [Thermoanaerobaculia bacterium]|nr:DUF2695 domain-containing protein [Thermoanaerobaculia bacterium]